MVSFRVPVGRKTHVGSTARTLDPSRSDVDLLEEIRGGDLSAYVVLYERHVEAARRLARSTLRNQADADDVVSEAFASVLAVIQRAKGPATDSPPT
jgi:DNA-directed RNA polymerase specialized sigma24 family protein